VCARARAFMSVHACVGVCGCVCVSVCVCACVYLVDDGNEHSLSEDDYRKTASSLCLCLQSSHTPLHTRSHTPTHIIIA